MSTKRASSALSFFGLAALGLTTTGCSSSSTIAVTDSGAGDASSSRDSAPPLDAGKDTAALDAGVEASSCQGLDAAVSGLTFPASCENCIGAHCCTQAASCVAAEGCKAIEECAAKCVAAGTQPTTCAERCIEGDAGHVDGAALSPAQEAAYTLDICLAGNCSNDCS